MGLKLIKKEVNAEYLIHNETTFEDYYDIFNTKFQDSLGLLTVKNKSKNSKKAIYSYSNLKLEDSILIILSQNRDRYLTTTEIARKINTTFLLSAPKGKDNISRYFNMKYYPYYEIMLSEGKSRFRLSQTGVSYSEIVKRKYTQ